MSFRTRSMTSAATLLAGSLLASVPAWSQQKPASDELDVTMQIIVDPDVKSTEEAVRRIALPTPAQDVSSNNDKQRKPDGTQKGQDRAREAQQSGREMDQDARDKAHEAAEQREQARRAVAEEKKKREHPPGPPPDRGPRP